MQPEQEEAAGNWIADNRLAGHSLADMPAPLKPDSENAGYRVQDRVVRRLTAAGHGNIVGWKVGVTTPQMRTHLGIEAPIAGAMLSAGRLQPGSTIRHADYCRIGIECEIAAVLRSPLGGAGPIDAKSAAAAVGQLHPAIEIVDDRYGGNYRAFGVPAIIADCAFHAAFVLGPPVADWAGIDLAAVKGVTRAGARVQVEGIGADVQGHPMASLAWLANRLTSLGRRLEPGQIVLTGSLPLPYWAKAGDAIEIEIDRLGQVRLQIS